ncbi:MAG TPA: phosphatase PAP2 family protein [Anaerolineales bacterium]|nr:phosphatase PAP2 family protein [Anaerolineales bacterium]
MNASSLLELDARLSGQMRVAEKPGTLRTIAVFLAHSGDSWFWGVALIILWLLSDSTWKEFAVVMFAGISLLAIVVLIVKFSVRRRRPEGEWGGIYRSTDPHSFPSGHAARAFLIAVIGSALGPDWLGVLLWIWAPLVALARVAMGVHFLSDVIAGSFLGIVVGVLGLQFSEAFFAWLTNLTGFALW